MRFRHERRDDPELNLVPLIDVLLMALIFLVVTTSFSKESKLRINLPEASTEAKLEETRMRISVDARGQYYINDTQLLNTTAGLLHQAMRQAAGSERSPIIVIYADGKAPHESVIRVMDVARQLGYTHLTFATQQKAGEADAP